MVLNNIFFNRDEVLFADAADRADFDGRIKIAPQTRHLTRRLPPGRSLTGLFFRKNAAEIVTEIIGVRGWFSLGLNGTRKPSTVLLNLF